MNKFAVIEAPSSLGLTHSGVEFLPDALKKAGLIEKLEAEYAGRVAVAPYVPQRDPATLLLNPRPIREYSLQLAKKVTGEIQKGNFPVVLGGDCSILIACMLALRRLGRYGLCFIDGHADFFQPEAEPNGEVASMELAIVSGRGPDILSDIDGLKPLVQDENIVAFGYRDYEDQQIFGDNKLTKTAVNIYDLNNILRQGYNTAVEQAVETLKRKDLDGFWIHLDADVLNDSIMPAVDYRQPGGLQWEELSKLLSALMNSGKAAGITVTIFNPMLDQDGEIAKRFTQCILDGLTTSRESGDKIRV